MKSGRKKGCIPWNKGLKDYFGFLGLKHPFSGKQHSQETKNKIRQAAKERFKDKTKHPRFGKKCPKSVGIAVAKANKERIWKEETLLKKSELMEGNDYKKGRYNFIKINKKW